MSNIGIDERDAKIGFFLPLVSGKNVLDLGVVQHERDRYERDTWLHRAIKVASERVIGVDIDREGVEYLSADGYEVVYGDVQRLNLDQTFDVVVAGDIIEHLTNLDGFLDSVGRHLNKTGIFAITTPNPFWWRTWVMVLLKGGARPHPEHTCWFCETTLQQLLLRKGFEIERIDYGTVYDLSRFTQRITKLINAVMPLPARFRHNTLMIVARKRTESTS